MDKRNNDFDFDFTPIGQAIKKARKAKGMTREQLACLLIRAGRLPATRHKLPDKSLRGNPLFIVAAGKTAPVALIPIEEGKPHRFFLVGGESIPSLR